MTRDKIAFQGEPGAYSDMACRQMHPELEPLPKPTFEAAIAAVRSALRDVLLPPEADAAMTAVSTADVDARLVDE